MIYNLPRAFTEELLYSDAARFADRKGFPCHGAVSEELFGGRSLPEVDLPTGLQHLIDNLQPGHPYTVDYLLGYHTLLPVFAPFMSPERLADVHAWMIHGTGHGARKLPLPGAPISRRLRFCPLCVEEDRRNHRIGTPYWHRVHQVPGVCVCPIHGCTLCDSTVDRIFGWSLSDAPERFPRTAYISAKRALEYVDPTELHVTGPAHDAFRFVAEDAMWLLSHPNTPPDSNGVVSRYRSLLAEQGYASWTGVIKVKPLSDAFQSYYPAEALASLGCALTLDDPNDDWLLRMLHRNSDHLNHPARHILLMRFLGHSAETFFALSLDRAPFGEGPWPCLNRAHEHFGQATIEHVDVTYMRSRKRPVGVFDCPCGFTYIRTGPDQRDEDRDRVGRVQSFGDVWEDRLTQLWLDCDVTLDVMAKALGVSVPTVQAHAGRLNLPVPRPGSRSRRRRQASLLQRGPREGASSDVTSRYRNAWLAAIARFPAANTTELRTKLPRIYSWLHYHDKIWLSTHPVRVRGRVRGVSRSATHHLEWDELDKQLVPEFERAIQRLRDGPRPRRLTVGQITAEAGFPHILDRAADRLPLTHALVGSALETRQQAALRRLQWVAAEMQKAGERITKSALIRRASISPQDKDDPELIKAIRQALGRAEPSSAHPA